MSIAAIAPPPHPLRHRFTIDEYERLADTGLLDGRRVELLNGDVADMPPMNDPRWSALYRLQTLLLEHVDAKRLLVQMPVLVPDDGEPEPDLAVLGAAWSFSGRKPLAADLALAIEVADSTLDTDLGIKVPLYARAGVPEVWVVDLPHQQVHLFSGLRDSRYAAIARRRIGDQLTPGSLPDVRIAVSAILG